MAYQFSCRDAGHDLCGWKVKASTEEELVRQLADHVKRVHHLKTVPDTIVNYAKTKVRQV